MLTILNKLRLIVNHPALVDSSLSSSYLKSGKMIALAAILDSLNWQDGSLQPAKVIIFSQYKTVLNLIENSLLCLRFKEVRFLRIAAEQSYEERFRNAERFNSDVDVKVLLVNSRIGSHGLNLSKAAVVVMFDHSYNPCEDQQAMDRAHRIGQKKVLMVYRLITKDTLEERLMNYQRFKTLLSSSVINLENSSIATLEDAGAVFSAVQEFVATRKEQEPQTDYGRYSKLLAEVQLEMIEEEAYRDPFSI